VGTLWGHTNFVRSLYIYDDKTLFSGSNDNTLRQWDLETGECTQVFSGHTSRVIAIAFSNGFLYSAAEDKTIRQWDKNVGKLVGATNEVDRLPNQPKCIQDTPGF
jgi:WD40 repeat protein